MPKTDSAKDKFELLSRRQREVMDIIYSMTSATAREVMSEMATPPSYAAVRTTLRSLVDKGLLTYEKSGKTFVYSATAETQEIADSALGRLLTTFYQDSVESLISGVLGIRGNKLSSEELRQIEQLIENVEEREKDDE